MANYDVETRIPGVLVHITYPDNKTKEITITGYAIHKKPRCKIDGMRDCRKVAETKGDISIVVERVINAVVDKYLNKDKKIIVSNSINVIDPDTKIGKTFYELKKQGRCFYNDWRKATQDAYIVFYEKNVIPEIQWCTANEDFGKVEFYDLVDKLAEKTLNNANFEGNSLDEAKEKVIRRINYAYPIFSEMRYMDPSIPDLYLRDNVTFIGKRFQKEQKKYIPPENYKKFRNLIESDLATNPRYVQATVLMENCALRTNEAAGWTQDLGEEFDNHFIIWVLVQGKEQNKLLKTQKGYRYVISDDWGYAMLKKCSALIEDKENTNQLTDTKLCEYIKSKLIEAGLSKEYISMAGNELQQSQMQGKNKGLDVAAYILRRNRASIWRNYCGYSQDELDYCLGHISANYKMKEDMWKMERRQMLSEKNRRFDLSPEVSQSPKYNPIDISKFSHMQIIQFPTYRFVNNGKNPVCVKINAVTSESGESVKLIHNDDMESIFKGKTAIFASRLRRTCTEIIGNIEDEIK